MTDEVRLIDAGKLIGYLHEKTFVDGDDRSMVYKAIEEQPTVEIKPDNGWISVRDRLPEPRTWVVVYIKYPSPVFEIESGSHKTGNIKKMFYDALGDYKVGDGKVTHWQPLPEPPKGE